MPKIVDHDARRAEILEATWRVIARQGLDAATVREIAKEAGYSNGILAHYFTNKDEILVEAHRLAFTRVRERADAAPPGQTPLDALRRALLEAMPLDEVRVVEAVLDVSFWGRALVDEHLNAVRWESIAGAREWWTDLVSAARAAGQTAPDLDVEVVVDEILALVDGVSLQAVMYPHHMTPERQTALVEALLARLRRPTGA